MSIFQEVILKLIDAVCDAAIKASEASDQSYFGSYTRDLGVAATKRRSLQQLLASPKLLKNGGKNDLERLSLFQSLLIQYREEVVQAGAEKALIGTTEELLGHLSDSLKLTYDQFERLGLLNLVHHKEDPLTIFHTLTGLYYAKKMLRFKQHPNERGSLAQRLLNINPFVKLQEQLLEEFFVDCQAAAKSFDRLLSKPHAPEGLPAEAPYSAESLKARLVLSSIYRLKEQHESLCSTFFWASKTASFQFFRETLTECLETAKQELKVRYPCAHELKPRHHGLREESDLSPPDEEASAESASAPSTLLMMTQLKDAPAEHPQAAAKELLRAADAPPPAAPLSKAQKKSKGASAQPAQEGALFTPP